MMKVLVVVTLMLVLVTATDARASNLGARIAEYVCKNGVEYTLTADEKKEFDRGTPIYAISIIDLPGHYYQFIRTIGEPGNGSCTEHKSETHISIRASVLRSGDTLTRGPYQMHEISGR